MINADEFFDKLKEKETEIKFGDDCSVVGKCFNDGLSTMANYAYITLVRMLAEKGASA